MNPDHEALKRRIRKLYKEQFEKNSFRMSMGELDLGNASMIAVCNYLAMGCTMMTYGDANGVGNLVDLHVQLKGLSSMLEREGFKKDVAYQFALVAGSIVELSLLMSYELVKQDEASR